jgi:predicted DNA-binding WGR domain protein
MFDLTLYRVDAAKNMWRFYRLDLQPDLFGSWLLVKEWGRIGCSGQMSFASFLTWGDAKKALHYQRRLKEKRGYKIE